MRKNSGQSLLESLIVSLVLVVTIKITLMFFLIIINILWMEHQLYQGLVCLAQKKEINQCKHRVLEQIKQLGFLGKINSLSLKEFQNSWKGEIQWNFYKKDFFIRQTLNFP